MNTTQPTALARCGLAHYRCAFVDGYHTGLLVAIVLLAAGAVVSYLTLRPRTAGSAAPASETTRAPADSA